MEEPIRVRAIQIVGYDLAQITVQLLFPSAFLSVRFKNFFEVVGRGQPVVLADLLKPLVSFRALGKLTDLLPLRRLLHLPIPFENGAQRRVAQL